MAQDTNAVLPKPRKSIVRLEMLGKSTLLGFSYERMVFHQFVDGFLSAGGGWGFTQDTPRYPNTVNMAFYVKMHQWEVNPLLGLGGIILVEDVKFRKPFQPFLVVMIGIDINLDTRWSFQINYTPMFGGPFQEGSQHFGGLNFGYKF